MEAKNTDKSKCDHSATTISPDKVNPVIEPEGKSQPASFCPCPACHGTGARRQKLTKREYADYKRAREEHERNDGEEGGRSTAPPPPPRPSQVQQNNCPKCSGSGLTASASPPPPNPQYPRVAIVGAGIGGSALAVACLHRGIPFTLFERDSDFEARSQGYGLTLQQASKAMAGLGISSMKDGVRSTRHIVHTVDGRVIGEWGLRRWVKTPTAEITDDITRCGTSEAHESAPSTAANAKRCNVHIARQLLRKAILGQLGSASETNIMWGHQLSDFDQKEECGPVKLRFDVHGEQKEYEADLLVGADGIRSAVRRLQIGDDKTPLRYLGCMVVLGICPLSSLTDLANDERLDSKTIFQTADGTTRIYVMPFTSDSVMWQLSFPIAEEKAKQLNTQGALSLKSEAIRRVGAWHTPIPEIVSRTADPMISGYPAYDRDLLSLSLLEGAHSVTLLGDAAHPMSPFKGQGANQAILDVLCLARAITCACGSGSQWKKEGIRKAVLQSYEADMSARSSTKVMESAAAAGFLHSEAVLVESDMTRGGCARRQYQKQ